MKGDPLLSRIAKLEQFFLLSRPFRRVTSVSRIHSCCQKTTLLAELRFARPPRFATLQGVSQGIHPP